MISSGMDLSSVSPQSGWRSAGRMSVSVHFSRLKSSRVVWKRFALVNWQSGTEGGITANGKVFETYSRPASSLVRPVSCGRRRGVLVLVIETLK